MGLLLIMLNLLIDTLGLPGLIVVKLLNFGLIVLIGLLGLLDFTGHLGLLGLTYLIEVIVLISLFLGHRMLFFYLQLILLHRLILQTQHHLLE
jgi:hypothetical protein